MVLLPRAWEYITPLGIPKERVVWIPNGVDLSLFPRSTVADTAKDHFTLMYFGAHGQANGLDNVARYEACAGTVQREEHSPTHDWRWPP